MDRSHSLKRHKEFRFTYRVGKAQSGRLMTLVYAKNRLPKSQIGFSVSKKVGNSVARNRCKRRLRAAFSPLLEKIKPGFNLIIVGRPEVLTAPWGELCSSAEKLLSKASLLV